MILTPYDTQTVVNTSGQNVVTLYYNEPIPANANQDLADTLASLTSYLANSGYTLTDSGQTTDGGLYIEYIQGTAAPATVTGSAASLVGQPSVIDNVTSSIATGITDLGKAINGGTLQGVGGLTQYAQDVLWLLGALLVIMFLGVLKK